MDIKTAVFSSAVATLIACSYCLFISRVAFAQAPTSQATQINESGNINGTIEARSARYKKNTVVYIEHVAGNFAPPSEHPVVDQKKLVFLPYVSVITRGTTVDFLNSDKVKHNIFSPSSVADEMNLGTYSSSEVRSWTFNKAGEAVLLCNVHAEMEAWIVIVQNPYFAITDRRGHFEIKGVPSGRYTLQVWNKKYTVAPQEVIVTKGETQSVSFKLKKKK